MKPFFIFLLAFATTVNSYAQEQDSLVSVLEFRPIIPMPTPIIARVTIRAINPNLFPVSAWTVKNTVGFDLSEIALVNWSAGGNSSISGLLKGNFMRTYATKNIKWVSELIVRYGINKQDGLEVRKADDEFRINSTFGYRKHDGSNWFHSAKFNFNTQFTNGYKYPNTDNAISKPLAPAYTFLGAGAEYTDKSKKLNFYISPLTFKNTLVLDQTLANNGAFGVTKAVYDADKNLITRGKQSKTEMGFLATNYYKKEIWKNISLENRLSLYSDYLNKFGNIDVDWKLQVDLVVNEYVSANIGTQAIYDDDVKNTEEENGIKTVKGATLQLKQTLGIGMVYVF